MRFRFVIVSFAAILAIVIPISQPAEGANNAPAAVWEIYTDPADAGFDVQRLTRVDSMIESSLAAAVMIVRDGKIVRSWGDIDRRFMCASVRKSLLNALYGVHVAHGEIDTAATLRRLGIDEVGGLTETELEATVADLLRSRSGIYLPSAFAPQSQRERLPARGSRAPGSFWYYNNWDFNALGTIFERQTGRGIGAAFLEEIAAPLQMQDYRELDYFSRREELSQHAAYLFKMSARDLARFGVLCANRGNWNGQQVLPASWVDQSTRSHSPQTGHLGFESDYGLLWWSAMIGGVRTLFAEGAGGQMVVVVPNYNLVIVHLVNTYNLQDVSDQARFALISDIFGAVTGAVQTNARSTPWPEPPSQGARGAEVAPRIRDELVGKYRHPRIGTIEVTRQPDYIAAVLPIGRFVLDGDSDSTFRLEDVEVPLVFVRAGTTEARRTARMIYDGAILVRLELYY